MTTIILTKLQQLFLGGRDGCAWVRPRKKNIYTQTRNVETALLGLLMVVQMGKVAIRRNERFYRH